MRGPGWSDRAAGEDDASEYGRRAKAPARWSAKASAERRGLSAFLLVPSVGARACVAAAILAAVVASADVSWAGPAPARGITVAVASGAFVPSEDVFADLYGSPQWPLVVHLDVPIGSIWGVFGGLRRLARDGTSAPVPPAIVDQAFPIELRLTGLRFGGSASARWRRAELFGAVGAEHVSGEEEWPAAGLTHDIDTWGAVVQAGTRIPVWRRLAVLAVMEFTSARVAADDGEDDVNLGGLAVLGGVAVRF